jgi:hypothetical protein
MPARKINPMWAMLKYHKPALGVPGSFDSVITRKYEVSDIASQANRKVKMLLAEVTRLILSKKRLSINPKRRSEACAFSYI